MNCPSCGRALGAAAKRCMYCGQVLAGAAPAPSMPDAPPPGDLLPDAPPPSPQPGIPSRLPTRRRRPALLRSGGTAKATMGGVLGAILICGFIGLKVCGAVKKVVGETVENKTVTLEPESEYSGTLQVQGSYSYTFEVAAIDGPVLMAVTSIQSKDKPSEAEILKLVAGSTEVKEGTSHKLTGRFSTGYYLWAVINTNDAKSVKARINFTAR